MLRTSFDGVNSVAWDIDDVPIAPALFELEAPKSEEELSFTMLLIDVPNDFPPSVLI